jgi:hypothetical protein
MGILPLKIRYFVITTILNLGSYRHTLWIIFSWCVLYYYRYSKLKDLIFDSCFYARSFFFINIYKYIFALIKLKLEEKKKVFISKSKPKYITSLSTNHLLTSCIIFSFNFFYFFHYCEISKFMLIYVWYTNKNVSNYK